MLVETEAEESERLAEAAKYSDEDSDEDDYRMNFAVPAAAEPTEPAVIVDTEQNMEWIKYEVAHAILLWTTRSQDTTPTYCHLPFLTN